MKKKKAINKAEILKMRFRISDMMTMTHFTASTLLCNVVVSSKRYREATITSLKGLMACVSMLYTTKSHVVRKEGFKI